VRVLPVSSQGRHSARSSDLMTSHSCDHATADSAKEGNQQFVTSQSVVSQWSVVIGNAYTSWVLQSSDRRQPLSDHLAHSKLTDSDGAKKPRFLERKML